MPTKDHEKLLSVLDEVVAGLAGQQAMTHEAWRNSYRELRKKLSAALATPDAAAALSRLISERDMACAEYNRVIRERDEARAALARYEADHAKTRP